MNCSRRISSSKSLFPTTLILRILETAPSSISKRIATRLRSSGLVMVLTVAAYLPCAKYWRLISCSALSNMERSKIRPSAKPICLRPSNILSLGNDLLPLKDMDAIAERSCTSTTRMPLSASIRTSLKNPVAYKDLMACVAFSSFMVSPTRTGK